MSTSARRSPRSGRRSSAARVDARPAEQLAQRPGEVRAQPRHAAELQRVRGLVQRDPAQQLLRVGARARAPRGRGSARRTAAAPAPSGSSTGNSYWPSTRPARKPEIAPASAASSAPPAVPTMPPSGPGRWPSASATGSSTPRMRAEVGVDPAAAADGLGDGQRGRRHEPRVGGDEPLALRGEPSSAVERRRDRPRAAGRATPWATVARRGASRSCPSQDAQGPGQPARPARAAPRASARPPPASAAPGPAARPSGSAQRVKATWPPASRTISCAAAASTARQPRSVTIPSSRAPPRPGTASTAIVPSARTRWRDLDERVGGRRGSSAGRPTRCRAPPAARRACGARPASGPARLPSSFAPSPRRATHSSPGPKSWT